MSTINNAPHLLGLTGEAGAGKDTAATLIAQLLSQHGRVCGIAAFADALYEEVGDAFSVTPAALKLRETKETPVQPLALERCKDPHFVAAVLRIRPELLTSAPLSPRQLLQWWGTDYRRQQKPSYWVDRLLSNVLRQEQLGAQHLVVTDVRFEDEAACLRAIGGQIWRIHRPNYQPARTGHVSETTGEAFAPEATITNHGTLDLLRIQLHQALLRASMAHQEQRCAA